MPVVRWTKTLGFLLLYLLIKKGRCSKALNIHKNLSFDKRELGKNSAVFDIPVISGCAMICSGNAECLSAVYDEAERKCFIFAVLVPQCTMANSSLILLMSPNPVYKDCQDAFNNCDRKSDEVYNIRPFGSNVTVRAVCKFDEISGWTVIQRRLNGQVNFSRPWVDYVHGFGDAATEYWLGLDIIYHLTKANQRVRFYLETHSGESRLATYSTFSLDDRNNNYTLHISGYSGTAGDSFSGHNGNMFTTYDRDNDLWSQGNCAQLYKGGWWYNACHASNLNGLWVAGGNHTSFADGITWYRFTGYYYSLKIVAMKVTRGA